jgi:ribosome-binding protein aMBF1 (putative translation factor)
MKNKSVDLNTILSKELNKNDFKILFDEHRFYLQIARLISELRQKAGLSQTEVAKKASVSQPMIARLERGDHQRTPTFDTIYKILKVLGYELSLSIQPAKKKIA